MTKMQWKREQQAGSKGKGWKSGSTVPPTAAEQQKAEAAARQRRPRTTPKVLTLGKCKQCGEPVVVAMQRGVPRHYYEKEEFCSANCCRDFHGVERTTNPNPGAPRKS
jgi:hypothetical protein